MASNGVNGHNTGPALCGVDEFVAQDYDYIVVGGGTAGLCVAVRLTENENVTVGVIEAGENRMDDKQITTPSLYPTLIGRPAYDWCMTSIPQKQNSDKVYSMPRGKVLGGSSAINYLMYVRGSKKDYDGWAEMGNKGWDWNGCLPYFKKHQTLDPLGKAPSDPQFMPHAGSDKYHGDEGPIHTSFNDSYMDFEKDFVKAAFDTIGTGNNLHDAWSGDHMGFYSSLAAVNRTTDAGKRSYAASGYLRPNLGRKNLKVLTEALASKIILDDDNQARGVEFIHDAKTHKVNSKRSVVLSAGVIQTPQLLELSGIGDPDILNKFGIKVRVENKGVGANFQDHVLGGMLYDLKPGIKSLDSFASDPKWAQEQQDTYDKTQKGPLGSPGMLMGFVSYADLVGEQGVKRTVDEINKNSLAKTQFAQSQERLIVNQLSDPTFANIQIFCIPARLDLSAGHDQIEFFRPPPSGSPNQVSLLTCLEHPLSRGSVHIQSADPKQTPLIDPGYFRAEADAKILAAGIEWMDKVAEHPLLKKSLGKRVQPPPDQSIATEAERVDYVKNYTSTQYHLIGTAAMGEVVDDHLRVKGVKGLRVVDASTFPGHVSGNIMSTTYMVAEKGSDLIKQDDERFS